ncbi:UNVERIFIED_CONTAM: Homeobox-leucine zipper protein HAT3 [Sesamum latifolium]|uniref:Homeobox-leucine zipper protein HAT3 n=1 Tax=Sesamum latifolium TaxID=2727402 RepID=A0AAW2YG15_9LAMI
MEDDGGDASGRKKLRLSKEQAAVLEETFKEHNTLNPKQKMALAKQLNLRPRQVEVWFQNRRARTKLKQTEVDCEYLRRCCENLTEENRRLQKEVTELRALKLSPQFYMNMSPPTTLTMCPQCERVAVSSSANTSSPIPANATGINRQPAHHQRPMTMLMGRNSTSTTRRPPPQNVIFAARTRQEGEFVFSDDRCRVLVNGNDERDVVKTEKIVKEWCSLCR